MSFTASDWVKAVRDDLRCDVDDPLKHKLKLLPSVAKVPERLANRSLVTVLLHAKRLNVVGSGPQSDCV